MLFDIQNVIKFVQFLFCFLCMIITVVQSRVFPNSVIITWFICNYSVISEQPWFLPIMQLVKNQVHPSSFLYKPLLDLYQTNWSPWQPLDHSNASPLVCRTCNAQVEGNLVLRRRSRGNSRDQVVEMRCWEAWKICRIWLSVISTVTMAYNLVIIGTLRLLLVTF